MIDADEAIIDPYEQRFHVDRNIRYHMRRAAFFMHWSRVTSFVGVFGCSAAVATLAAKAGTAWPIASTVIVALASALDLVVGTGQKAWLHNDLRRRYIEIAEHIEGIVNPTERDIRELKARFRRIEADEPPTLQALELMVRNDVIVSQFSQDELAEHFIPLPWYQRLTAQLINWDTSLAAPQPMRPKIDTWRRSLALVIVSVTAGAAITLLVLTCYGHIASLSPPMP